MLKEELKNLITETLEDIDSEEALELIYELTKRLKED